MVLVTAAVKAALDLLLLHQYVCGLCIKLRSVAFENAPEIKCHCHVVSRLEPMDVTQAGCVVNEGFVQRYLLEWLELALRPLALIGNSWPDMRLL